MKKLKIILNLINKRLKMKLEKKQNKKLKLRLKNRMRLKITLLPKMKNNPQNQKRAKRLIYRKVIVKMEPK